MLKLTRLNNQVVAINPDHICSADATPDTVLTLVGGERMVVRESLDDVIDLLVAYRRLIRASGVRARDADGVAKAVTPRQASDRPRHVMGVR
jgi:flagellar protein FlbD